MFNKNFDLLAKKWYSCSRNILSKRLSRVLDAFRRICIVEAVSFLSISKESQTERIRRILSGIITFLSHNSVSRIIKNGINFLIITFY